MTFRTRFAPSPTGPLHLGHAYSALLAHDMEQAHGGTFLLRIEDIDQSRARPQWEAQIHDDLHWLGLRWPTPVLRQSERLPHYRAALQELWDKELLFACQCNRRDIAAAAAAPQEGAAPPLGPDGIIYPGTCRANTSQGGTRPLPETAALRLNMARACAVAASAGAALDGGAIDGGAINDGALNTGPPNTGTFAFTETGQGPSGDTGQIRFDANSAVTGIGDVVLARRDFGTSYHLSVVLDDAAQQISHVVRGQDLFDATRIHVILQRVLGLPTPAYHHHRLIRDEAGKRLAKRDDARAIATYRAEGMTPEEMRRRLGL